MSTANHPLRLHTSIKDTPVRLAKEDGVSLNRWIASEVAQKVGAAEAAVSFFPETGGGAQAENLNAILALAPDLSPIPATNCPAARNPDHSPHSPFGPSSAVPTSTADPVRTPCSPPVQLKVTPQRVRMTIRTVARWLKS